MKVQKPIVVVISDLHVGGGGNDPGDDHIYQGDEFVHFLNEEIPECNRGQVELFINGDFLEFAQVRPDAYTLGSQKYWCSEDESVIKLVEIIDGHRDIFDALNEFREKGNHITIAAGNHDVDLWWGQVQEKLKEAVGDIEFALGEEWYSRYEGRLAISHGHMLDPANRFKHWDNPILDIPGGTPRLEMCPGTLFMVKFVNWLENQYPFADNLKPITALARVLYKEDRTSFKAAAWTLLKFVRAHPYEALSSNIRISSFGEELLHEISLNDSFAQRLANLYYKIGKYNTTINSIRMDLKTEQDLIAFLAELIAKVEPAYWLPVFDSVGSSTLDFNNNGTTLSIARAGMLKDKEVLREAGINQLAMMGKEVVICGHTHQPDEWRGLDGKLDGGYFNPGSWTRYVDANVEPKLTLEDLKHEEDFPYQLNYIRVEQMKKTGKLRADKICYKQQALKR